MRQHFLAAVVGCLCCIPCPSFGAQCAGFVDVDDADPSFCAAVTYLKNTGITLGCIDSSHFCPVDPVTRLQMALFIQRLADKAVFKQGGNAFGSTATIGTTDQQSLAIVVGGHPIMRGVLTGGGGSNPTGTLGGDVANSIAAGAFSSVIAGGGLSSSTCGSSGSDTCANRVMSPLGVIGGGAGNFAGDFFAVVGGGYSNGSAHFGTVAGGGLNGATGDYSAVGGGDGNKALGTAAAIPGGASNTAAGAYSVVLGRSGETTETATGTFVFSDSTANGFFTSIPNEFAVMATGGIRLLTDKVTSAGCTIAAGAGTWTCTSSRAAKRDFADVDTQAVLDKVVALPVMRWRYKGEDASIRHLGTFAEDFHDAFGLGVNDKSISMADADGVALAAIKGLNAKLERENAALRARLEAIEHAIAR